MAASGGGHEGVVRALLARLPDDGQGRAAVAAVTKDHVVRPCVRAIGVMCGVLLVSDL